MKMKSIKGRISIIVPIYNPGFYLRETIESLGAQTYQDIEILLINDGCTDDSLAICQLYAKTDKRIKVVTQANQGVSVARNQGLDLASGEYLMFVDADDWLEPQTCQKAYEVAVATVGDIIIWSHINESVNRQKKIATLSFPADKLNATEYCEVMAWKDYVQLNAISRLYKTRKDILITGNGVVWGKLYRRDLVQRSGVRFVEGVFRSQDTLFNINIMEYARKIIFLDQYLYHYRLLQMSTVAIGTYVRDCQNTYTLLLREYQKFITEYQKPATYYQALQLKTIVMLHQVMIHDYCNRQNPDKPAQTVRRVMEIIRQPPYNEALATVRSQFLSKRLWLMKFLLQRRLIRLYFWFHEVYYGIRTMVSKRYKRRDTRLSNPDTVRAVR